MTRSKVSAGEAIEGELGIPAGFAAEAPELRDRTRNIRVRHVDRDRFLLEIRDHVVLVDQPVYAGGEDTGPTPTELFIGSIAACTAYFAERFLVRHGITRDDLTVSVGYEMSEGGPHRVVAVDLDIDLPPSFPEERRAALMAVLERCTVKNSLHDVPEVALSLRTTAAAA